VWLLYLPLVIPALGRRSRPPAWRPGWSRAWRPGLLTSAAVGPGPGAARLALGAARRRLPPPRVPALAELGNYSQSVRATRRSHSRVRPGRLARGLALTGAAIGGGGHIP